MQIKFGEIEHLHETIALRPTVCVVKDKEEVKVANVIFCKKTVSCNFGIQTKHLIMNHNSKGLPF